MPDTYDSPWKELLDDFFPEFLELFFPAAHPEIDWNRGFESLDKELAKVVRDSQAGDRVADKLMKVWRLDGSPQGVLVHLELQNHVEVSFEQRMFTYFYRIFDRYRLPVVSLAVLGDDHESWRPDRYGWSLWGCEVAFRFPSVKLIDFEGQREHLRQTSNPLAFVVEAHLATRRTRKRPTERLQQKLAITRRLVLSGLDRPTVLKLFRGLDWLLSLPPELDQRFLEEHQRFEESQNMRYVTSIERLYIEEGMAQGMQKGMAQGMQKGMAEGSARMVERLLDRRFGPLPSRVRDRLSSATSVELEAMADRVLDATSIEEVLGGDSTTRESSANKG